MAQNPNESFSETDGRGSALRCFARNIQVSTFAVGSGILAALTPVAFNTSLNQWVVWNAGTNQVTTITGAGTPGGTYTLTVGGQTTGNIAVGASAATILAALVALSNIAPEDVTVSQTATVAANGVVSITFKGAYRATAVVVTRDATNVTGGGATVTAGTGTAAAANVNGAGVIKGFVWPDPITLDDTDEVLGKVVLQGQIHFSDIPVPSGETLAQLKTAMLDGSVRKLGFAIQGLPGYH